MKLKKSISFSICALTLLSSCGAILTTNNHVNAATTQSAQDIQYRTGVAKVTAKTAVYTNPASQKTSRYLPVGSNWSFFKVANVNGQKWFNLGGDQWVNGADLSVLYGSGSPELTDSAHSINAIVEAYAQRGNSVRVYSQPSPQTPTSQTLPNGTKWKAFESLVRGGVNWLKLGTNQYVRGFDTSPVSSTNTQNSKPQPKISSEVGTAKVTYKTPIVVWGNPGSYPLNRYLPIGSNWKFFKIAEVNGEKWLNLGGNQWIPQKYVTLGQDPRIGFYLPTIKSGAIAKVTNPKGTKLYNRAGKYLGRVLPAGSSWRVFNSYNNGVPMLNVGGDQWINLLDTNYRL